MMLRLVVFRLSRRRAVGTIIGGLIILTLILAALGTMISVLQQYDQYQQATYKMAGHRDQGQSENLVAISPGLTIVNTTISGWGSGCDGSGVNTYNCYVATISNLGGVGVQIVRIYINSTGLAGSGCSSPNPQPCILNPTSTIASYAFNQANQFLNPGEVNHQVYLALPLGVGLPSLYYSQNTIFIATSRGNVFSFQWPFPIQIVGGQSQSAFSVGILKVAYQDTSAGESGQCSGSLQYGLLTYGCDSSHDYNGAKGNTSPNAPYCHNEPLQTYPAGSNYAETLTFPSGVVVGTTLYFVNPWITNAILESARTDEESGSSGGCTSNCPTTQLYIYINITNTGSAPYTVGGGSLDLTFYGSNHITGNLIGIYYGSAGQCSSGQCFYAASPTQQQTVAVGKSFYAIFKVTALMLGTGDSPATWPPSSSAMFWGSLSMTSDTETATFVGGAGLSSGLWIRLSC